MSPSESDTGLDEDLSEGIPAWFALQGKVVIDAGTLVAADLNLEIYPEETSDGVLEGCGVEVEAADWESVDALPDTQIYTWWKFLEMQVLSDPCELRQSLPEHFYLGLGALLPELTPELVALEMEQPEHYLYSAFASFEELDTEGQQDVYAFGFAGTQENLDQVSEVVQAAPLPGGTYLISAVYLFPLAD